MILGSESHAFCSQSKAHAHLGGRDFQDVQGLHQVQQALNIQVAQVALFLLSFPRHLAILVLP